MKESFDKYRCKHGVLGHCDYCWAERFRNRLSDPEFQMAREKQRLKEMNPEAEDAG